MRLTDQDIEWLRQFEGFDYALENSGRYADTLALVKQYISPGSKVLDLGVYPGHLALMLRRECGANITGISLAHTRAFSVQMGRHSIAVGTANVARDELPCAEGSFDLVLCTEIIEHLDNPLHLLAKANRVLKNERVLILSTPNLASLKNRVRMALGIAPNPHLFGVRHVFQMNEWVHKREYTVCELRGMLAATGFSVERVMYSRLDHHPTSIRRRLGNWLKRVGYAIPSFRGGIILVARKTTEARFTSLLPDVLRARISAARTAITARPGETVELAVVLENTGNSTWLRSAPQGYGFVRLGGHLYDAGNRLLDFDFHRQELPRDIEPGEKTAIALHVVSPLEQGEYCLEIDLVSEDVSWFRDFGSETAVVDLKVRGE